MRNQKGEAHLSDGKVALKCPADASATFKIKNKFLSFLHMHLQTLPHLQKTPVLQYFVAKPKSISDTTPA